MRMIGIMLLAALAVGRAQEAKRPPVTGVAHIALFSRDVDKSRQFYKDLLGYDEPFDLNLKRAVNLS